MKFIKKWFKRNSEALKFVSLAFVIWQVALILIIFLGNKYFPATNEFLYFGRSKEQISLYNEKEAVMSPSWLWSRANFDGMDYLDIARCGYSVNQQSFFPLYPKLIAFFRPLFGGKNLITAWSINLASLYLALFFFYKLVALNFSERVSRRSLFFLLLFPTSFFFSMIYTEALFFLLIIGSFYFAKTKRWWLAGIFGGLAAATRLPGIFLLPALAFEWWEQFQNQKNKSKKKDLLKSLFFLLLVPLGLLFYMRFLSVIYQDSLMFAHVQTFFGAGRSTDKIILLYQVFWRYFKMLVMVDKQTLIYLTVVMEFLAASSFLVFIVFTFLKRWYSYLIFMVLAYIAPSLTGTFLSLPRFALVLFPAFILLALWSEKYRWLRILYGILMIPLLIFLLLLFTRGFWAA